MNSKGILPVKAEILCGIFSVGGITPKSFIYFVFSGMNLLSRYLLR